MRTTTIIALSILLTVSFSSCKKDSTSPTTYPNFSQLKIGNYWIYERFNVDSSGNATTTGIYDSCYVEKDTMIGNVNYYKVVRPATPGLYFDNRFVKDSLHYIVNHLGQILFSSQNFSDTFHNYFVLAAGTDTVCNVVVKMADKELSVNTPSGQYTTYSFNQTFSMYPSWTNGGNPRRMDTRYSENIGIVVETLPFFANNPSYVQRRLIRYNLN